MSFSNSAKLSSLLGALRQRAFPRRVLVAGPFVGEFGHELMEWQGVIRARRPHYQEVHVITYPGREYLYPGCTVHSHDVRLETAGYGLGRFSPRELADRAHALAQSLGLRDYDLLTPLHTSTRYHRDWIWRQQLVKFVEPPAPGPRRDIGFHFRAVDKVGPDKLKNYPPALADELVRLCQSDGYHVCCVGHPDYAYCPPFAEDLRFSELRQSVAAMASVTLVAGEDSGGMHLAKLCGTPIVVWAAAQWRVDYSLRWNPFHVPVIVAANDTHLPDPARIKTVLDRALAQLRTPSASAAPPPPA